MTIREQIEKREQEILSPFACLSINSRGRDYALFAVGVVPAIVAIIIRAFVPEPPIFEEHKASGKKHGNLASLFNSPTRIKYSVIIIILCTVQNAGYFGIMTWLPKYLNGELGLSLTSTGMWTAVTVIGMMIGISVFGWLADKAGRRPRLDLPDRRRRS